MQFSARRPERLERSRKARFVSCTRCRTEITVPDYGTVNLRWDGAIQICVLERKRRDRALPKQTPDYFEPRFCQVSVRHYCSENEGPTAARALMSGQIDGMTDFARWQTCRPR